ncbi:N-acetylmuramoyl-L-alanine amidase [Jannaschia seohaensis]|uniref:N-acetylmuramoyl-L-alanine amidase n=1 Tax=Jannaschia seohaensis TaxID=475081 RepID=A0A2Y9AVK7_9RHOB|nr:N-acetylmuramoyl-L-alanine amidase [Jannaschia seohaensis]PWJ17024.1 N-acetylmuramoyl-L-alanine amidase [Jannaschia seohaensis]SSA48361.1 N-acetylmuramoyl-L-alanine amidase [Jannaschia seohaensis]
MRGGAGPAIDWLCSPAAQVSAHYVIDERGPVARLVPEDRRAWHAGAGSWGGCDDVNSISIGIELSNDGAAPFPEPQMARLEALLRGLMKRHGIPPQGVIGHSDCAPGRKIDPGPRFDWRRLARQGLAVWPEKGAQATDEARFARDMRRAGWTAAVPIDTLLHSLRLRFRPWATGPLDGRDCAIAADIARRFPVDPPHGNT